jgi:hypothetical protein
MKRCPKVPGQVKRTGGALSSQSEGQRTMVTVTAQHTPQGTRWTVQRDGRVYTFDSYVKAAAFAQAEGRPTPPEGGASDLPARPRSLPS